MPAYATEPRDHRGRWTAGAGSKTRGTSRALTRLVDATLLADDSPTDANLAAVEDAEKAFRAAGGTDREAQADNPVDTVATHEGETSRGEEVHRRSCRGGGGGGSTHPGVRCRRSYRRMGRQVGHGTSGISAERRHHLYQQHRITTGRTQRTPSRSTRPAGSPRRRPTA